MSFFDERAATWDDEPERVERSRTLADAVRAAVPLARSTRLLEYGAGTALLSQALAADVGPLTVADPSAGMRDVMLAKVAAGALPPGTRVWDLDLTTAAVPREQFDVIATVMALHHIGDLSPVLHGFTELLAPGGHLCIVDLVAEDGSFHDDEFTGHHGFDTDELQLQLEEVGLGTVQVRQVYEVVKDDGTYPLFLMTTSRTP